MEFLKYRLLGDYHWQEFINLDSIYRQHALKVAGWVKESNVLDIGCGDGLITSLLGCKGVDIDKVGISLAREHGADVELGDVYCLEGKYDAVYLGDVLEHLERPDDAIREIAKITNKLYVTTPPRGERLGEYHLREWTQDELKVYIEGLGWQQVSSEVANCRIYALFVVKNEIGLEI